MIPTLPAGSTIARGIAKKKSVSISDDGQPYTLSHWIKLFVGGIVFTTLPLMVCEISTPRYGRATAGQLGDGR